MQFEMKLELKGLTTLESREGCSDAIYTQLECDGNLMKLKIPEVR